MESLVGRRLGKYELTAMIGGGGMATVYQARHPGLGQQVAVKILHPFLSTDASFIDRFRREAHAVAALRHPNIVRVLDFDHEDELYYMVMEYIGGPTLSSVITARKVAGGLSLPEIRRIFPPLCSAVDYAAGRGMIHRDIKPANIIMSEDGEPILTDYGIAKMIGSTALTSPGTVVGSAHYMSPEQAQGYECDVRSDLYSLGIVLFEALSGTVPFDGDTTVTVLLKHISAPIPSIRALRPNLPPALEVMLARALAKQPQDRYEMGDSFADELLAALRPTKTMTVVGEPVVTAAPSAPAVPAPVPVKAQPAEPETAPPEAAEPSMPPVVTPPAAAPPTPQAGEPAPEAAPPAPAAAVPVMPIPPLGEPVETVNRLSEVGAPPPAPPAPPETPVPVSFPSPDGATRVEMTRVEEPIAPVAPVTQVPATEDHVPVNREVAAPEAAAAAPAQESAAPEAAVVAYADEAAVSGVTAAAAVPTARPTEFEAQWPSAEVSPLEPPPLEPPPVEPPSVPPPTAAAAAAGVPDRPDQAPGGRWTGAPAPAPAPLAARRREPGRRGRMWLIIAAVALVVIAAGAVGTWLALKSDEDDSNLSTTTTSLSTTTTARPTTTSTLSTTTSTVSTTTTQPTTTTIATTTTVATTTTTARPTTTVRRTTTTARPTTTTARPTTTSPPDTIGPGTTSPPDTIGPG